MYCRFADNSLELRELGLLIREKMSHNEDPFFIIQEHERGSSKKHEKKYVLDADLIFRMTKGKFNMAPFTISLNNKLSESEISLSIKNGQAHPISGFPRCLVDDDISKTSTPFMEFTLSKVPTDLFLRGSSESQCTRSTMGRSKR